MEEIKFRVWDPKLDNGRMLYFDSFEEIVDWQGWDEWKLENSPMRSVDYMQYTGLKDKNGKEIYEGDILEFSTFDYNGADTQHIGVVYWCDGEFLVDGTQKGDDDEVFSLSWVFQDSELEVIGNKFENPDLLEGN